MSMANQRGKLGILPDSVVLVSGFNETPPGFITWFCN